MGFGQEQRIVTPVMQILRTAAVDVAVGSIGWTIKGEVLTIKFLREKDAVS